MKKNVMVIVLLAVIALSLSGSDLTIKKFADNAQKYISLTEEMDCIEVAADGYTMPFTWTFILTDDYAEFRFRWPNGRYMESPSYHAKYTIIVISENEEAFYFDGYTSNAYFIRVSEDSLNEFRNCLSVNEGMIKFTVIQHDYKSDLIHTPQHAYLMDFIDTSDINALYMEAFSKELYFNRNSDPTRIMIGLILGPSFTSSENQKDAVNVRLGATGIYFPYNNISFSLGIRSDVSLYQANGRARNFLFDISAALYMSNYFYINKVLSLRLEYGIGASYIHNPVSISYPPDSFAIRIPIALSFVINKNWNVAIDIILDAIANIENNLAIVPIASGGISFRYGF